MSAIEKLFAAAEACLEYKSGWSTAMADAIAPARAEWERKRKEREALAASHSDMSRRLCAPEPCRSSGWCRSPTACDGWDYCRERNNGRCPDAATQQRYRTEAVQARARSAGIPVIEVAR